jgi:hypothetical protein
LTSKSVCGNIIYINNGVASRIKPRVIARKISALNIEISILVYEEMRNTYLLQNPPRV